MPREFDLAWGMAQDTERVSITALMEAVGTVSSAVALLRGRVVSASLGNELQDVKGKHLGFCSLHEILSDL